MCIPSGWWMFVNFSSNFFFFNPILFCLCVVQIQNNSQIFPLFSWKTLPVIKIIIKSLSFLSFQILHFSYNRFWISHFRELFGSIFQWKSRLILKSFSPSFLVFSLCGRIKKASLGFFEFWKWNPWSFYRDTSLLGTLFCY